MAGEDDLAIRLLSNVVKRPAGPSYGSLKLNPIWDDLRTDPCFDKIIAVAAEPVKLD
jgi:hypothetical protein